MRAGRREYRKIAGSAGRATGRSGAERRLSHNPHSTNQVDHTQPIAAGNGSLSAKLADHTQPIAAGLTGRYLRKPLQKTRNLRGPLANHSRMENHCNRKQTPSIRGRHAENTRKIRRKYGQNTQKIRAKYAKHSGTDCRRNAEKSHRFGGKILVFYLEFRGKKICSRQTGGTAGYSRRVMERSFTQNAEAAA